VGEDARGRWEEGEESLRADKQTMNKNGPEVRVSNRQSQ
jgi:hypothetical protein